MKIKPFSYQTKVCIALQREMPAKQAVARLLDANLYVMENNIPGMLDDTDIEFLHHFRVASRRSRSIIKCTGYIYPEPELVRLRKKFSGLSKLTSLHRDLDVLIYDLRTIAAKDKHFSETAMEELVSHLAKARWKEHEKMVRYMGAGSFRQFLVDLRTFVERQKNAVAGTLRDNPASITVANNAISKNYYQLLKYGSLAGLKNDYKSIHNLRKSGKSLRYLIESFASLYDEEEIDSILLVLKKLQGNLGDIVDMHVQARILCDWKQQALMDDGNSVGIIKTVNKYIKRCTYAETRAQARFSKVYRQFSAKSRAKKFATIFGAPGK